LKFGFCFGFSAAVALVLSAAQAHAQQRVQALHGHVGPAVSSGQAKRIGDMRGTERLNVTIVLAPHNQPDLVDLLGQLYDPSSPAYHRFLSTAQFTEKFSPSAEDYEAAVDFARAHRLVVTDRPANRLIIPVTGTVEQIESAFNVRMGLYQHPTEPRTFYSPDREPSLELGVPVAHIAGLDNYSVPKPMVRRSTAVQGAATPAAGTGPGGAYLGSDMRSAYYGGTALTGTGQSVGLVEFDGYNLSDVNLTFSNSGQSYSVPINNVLLDGATGAACQLMPSDCSDAEQVLDIAQAIWMAPQLSQVRVYIGSNDPDILNAIAADDIAQQVSISWTWLPDDPSTDDIFFEEMAAQGQSVFAASGDDGEFDPLINNFYPAEDAWVTSVGGTDLVTTGAGGAWSSETAWTDSGGGISPDGITLPSWQSGVANASNGGSNALRNVPDVAMEANTDNYDCNLGTCAGAWGGTSFAAPRWAGFMALANEQAATSGDTRIGFANPALYAIGESSSYGSNFHDITSGNNDVEGTCCGQAFYNAVPGYDLVTGWGSPAGQDLINSLAPAGASGFQLSASSTSLTITPGSSGTTTITVKDLSGFTGSVELAVSGLPSGVTASWGSNPTSASSTLILTVGNSAVRGSYLINVAGTSGSLTGSTEVALEVNAPGFTIAASPETLTLEPGQSLSTTVTVTDEAGFSGSVNLAVTSALPAGVTAAWNPDPATGTSVLTLTASSSATANLRGMVTIEGSSGTAAASTTVALNLGGPIFLLGISPEPVNIVRGNSTTSTVTVLPAGGFTGSVTLSATELPAGVTATFNPVTTTGTSTLTMTASSSAALGTSAVQIMGTSAGCCTSYTTFNQTVTTSPTFNLSESSLSLNVTQGGTATDTITVNPLNGFTGSVNLAATNLPSGVSASWSKNPTSGTSVLTISAAANAPVGGQYLIIVTGSSGNQGSQNSIEVTINPPPGFTLSPSSSSLSVMAGSSVTDKITVTPQTGFSGSVNLAVTSALPNGVSASFGTNPTTGSSVLTLVASSSAAPGNYPVTVAGTSNGMTVTTSVVLSVEGAVGTSTVLSVNPTGTLTGGTAYTLTATVTPASGTATPTGNVVFTIGTGTQTVALNAAGVAAYSGTAPSSAGPFTISATYQGSTGFLGSTSNTLNETVVAPQTTTVTSANSTTFTVGTAGSFAVTATGFPAPTFSETGALPTGVTFTSAGVLSGTPGGGTGGTYNIIITAQNGVSPNATQGFTLTVDQPPTIDSASSTTFVTGTAGSFSVTTYGYPAATFSESGALPTGVTLTSAGTLSGTPAAGTGGSYGITITALNGISPNSTQSFTLIVNQAPAITSASSTTFTVGTAGTFAVTGTGHPAPTFSETGTLPSGVTFTGAGVFSGKPAAGTGGQYSVTITASNGAGPNVTQNFTLIVNQAPAITSASGTTFAPATSGSFTVTATGYPTPTFTKTGASLPGTVTLSSNGTLSGTPGAGTGGTYSITITASNGVSQSATQSFVLTVGSSNVTINWTPATTITYGSAGANVLNAAANCGSGCGSFTYAATPMGGSPASITSTSGLAAGTYTITAYFTPSNSKQYSANSATATLTVTNATACTNPNPNPNPNPASFANPDDFNGDCRSDILWRNNTSEQVYEWMMNGTSIANQGSPGGPTSAWVIEGVGDFDGDGKSDILWQNSSTGEVYIWLMNGTSIVNQGTPGTVSPSSGWVIQGVGDFNGDGKADILWRNSTSGDVYIWQMNGTSIASQGDLGIISPSSGWVIQGVGDFNGDGKADILWRNTTNGEIYIWLMNGTNIASQGEVGIVSPSSGWAIQGIGDFDGNGTSDILWQNTTSGEVYLWLMSGTTITSQGSPFTLSPSSGWVIQGVGDYNGDGKADILWRNSTSGDVCIWLMNGTSIASQGDLGDVSSSWKLTPLVSP